MTFGTMEKLFAWLRDFFRNDDIVSALTGEAVEPPFFDPKRKRNTQISTVVGYVSLVALVVFLSTVLPEPPSLRQDPDLPDLIFVMTEGPGGGGGGGGNKMPDPPRKAELPGKAKITVPVEKPPVIEPPKEPPKEEPKEEPKPIEAITIPALAQASAAETLTGAIDTKPGPPTLSQGSGSGGGAGTGTGTGIGPGTGSGLGPGSGGGTGGGFYQPGNGVTTPIALDQVKPQYTSEAMRARIQGTVWVECIVQTTGVCTDVHVVRSLDQTFGLDREAVKAAQQWRFKPGMRFGQPVPVLVTIELSFALR